MTPEQLALFEQYQDLPRKILNKTFKNPRHMATQKRLEFDDLLQFCNMGLLRACVEFSPKKKVKFTSFAINHIKWNLFKRMSQESIFRRYKGKAPNEYAERHNDINLSCLDTPIGNDENDMTLHEMCPSEKVVEDDVVGIMLEEYILERSTERQKKVFEYRIKECSLREISEHIGVSSEMVRLDLNKIKQYINDFYKGVER